MLNNLSADQTEVASFLSCYLIKTGQKTRFAIATICEWSIRAQPVGIFRIQVASGIMKLLFAKYISDVRLLKFLA